MNLSSNSVKPPISGSRTQTSFSWKNSFGDTIVPSLSAHQSNSFVKLLLIGDAQAGKTGSLTSLAKAGYKLRILDYDNKLDVLKYFILHECKEAIENVEFIPLRDKRKSSPLGPILDGQPKAFIEGMKLLDSWNGKPQEWGPDYILVIDSLSRLCDAAFDFHEFMGKAKDPRQTFYQAQQSIENVLAGLTSASFQTNILVLCHVNYMDMPDGTKKGFPQGVGQALSPKIPQYFPSAVLYTNKGGKRTIQTNSTPLIDLANPAPFAMQPSYQIGTGLAEFFKVLREPPNNLKVRR